MKSSWNCFSKGYSPEYNITTFDPNRDICLECQEKEKEIKSFIKKIKESGFMTFGNIHETDG